MIFYIFEDFTQKSEQQIWNKNSSLIFHIKNNQRLFACYMTLEHNKIYKATFADFLEFHMIQNYFFKTLMSLKSEKRAFLCGR